jgi:PAS domain S-box-containing protein
MSLPISPGIIYYVRKLLRQNLDHLRFVRLDGRALVADGTRDIDEVLDSLYPSLGRKMAALQKLEHLTIVHQALSSSATTNNHELRATEAEIFKILGFEAFDPMGKGCILVVDDAPDDQQLLCDTLQQQGYRVETATQGQAAIAMLQTTIPDAVLLEILLPEMDGYAVCEALRKISVMRDVPIIFMSSVEDVASKVKAFSVGGSDLIAKPFQREEVLVRIEHQLRLRNQKKHLESQNLRLQEEVCERQEIVTRYRGLFDHAVAAMFQADLTGRFMDVNCAFARLYGYETPAKLLELVSDIGIQLYDNPKRLMELYQQLKQQGEIINAESRVRRYDGKLIWVSENMRAVTDKQGSIVYYEGTVQEIIALKIPTTSAENCHH